MTVDAKTLGEAHGKALLALADRDPRVARFLDVVAKAAVHFLPEKAA